MAKKLETPYKDLLPPLSTDELDALTASIKTDGVRDPITIDEENNILDGHNRYQICKSAPTRVISGLTDAEKQAYVYQSNFLRRNLSPSQKKDSRKAMKKIAAALRKEDPKKNTQKVVAAKLGVARTTVEGWFIKKKNISNDEDVNTNTPPKPDARTKVNPTHKPIIADRVASGESQAQVAADYGITQGHVSNIVTKERKAEEAKDELQEAIKELGSKTAGIKLGDFRVLGKNLSDESVDLIFTDPPYDEQAVPLYGELAELAARVLKPGSWCLAYTGHRFLPEVFKAMQQHLTYGWTFAIRHSGGDLRFRLFKLQNKWKPIVGFYKPDLSVHWDWFPDMTSGGKEKDDHEWQQALSEAEHFIGNLTIERAVILDPMCGSGTTCLAAKNLNRQWIGMELDKDTVKTARVKLK